jgi:Phosphate-selective porin O and P
VFADTSSVMRGRPIRLTSNGFAAWPILMVQAQATPYVGKNASFAAGDIAERPGFRLRRARFGMGGSYESLLHVRFTSELNSDTQSALTVRNAWLGFTPKEYFGAYMGIVDVPFSRSGLMPTADTALIDRPLAVRSLSPFQQLGMLVGGSVAAGKLQYYLGLFNGFQRSDLFYSGYRDSMAALGNRFDNLAYAARVGTSLLSSGPEIAAYRDTNDQLNAGASYFYSDGGARDIHSMEGDIYFQKSGVRVLVEALYSITAPESVPSVPTTQTAKIDSYAIVLEGGYTFRRAIGGHLRFEWIDPNTAVADASDNWLLTAGLTFAPPVVGDIVKAQLEFTHREEVHGASLENDSLTLQTQFVLQ